MAKFNAKRAGRVFFDLNHPADFNLFRELILKLGEDGYKVKVTARNKDRLHRLLKAEGIRFSGRGRGMRFIAFKYVYGILLLLLTFARVLFFRPGLTVSFSSPYLVLASRVLRIPTLCFDDNDTNVRLHSWTRLAHYMITPSSYTRKFHEQHFRIPIFKELAYLPAPVQPEQREGIFVRIGRTDTTHHSKKDALDFSVLRSYMESFSDRWELRLSAESGTPSLSGDKITEPGVEGFHDALNQSNVFWGNSATMAAEASLLGIPSVYVSAEISSGLKELKEAGLLYHYTPDQLESSLQKAEELLETPSKCGHYCVIANWIRKSKIDVGAFLYWVVTTFPESVEKLQHEPDWYREFGDQNG